MKQIQTNQRIVRYKMLAEETTMQQLVSDHRERESRISDYRSKINDPKTFKSVRERLQKELDRARKIDTDQQAQLAELLKRQAQHVKVPEKIVKTEQVGDTKLPVPEGTETTLDKYKNDPAFKEAVAQAANAKFADTRPEPEPQAGSGVSTGSVLKYTLIAGLVSWLFYKIRNVSMKDLTDFYILLLMAVK